MHLAAFRQQQRSTFPETTSSGPYRPRDLDSDIQGMFIGPTFPFPFISLTDADGNNGIGFQNDRFARTWEFSDSAYPGYSELSNELESLLASFFQHIKDEIGVAPVLTAAECNYTNHLGDFKAGDLMVGVATKWTADVATETLNAEHASIYFHVCDDDELRECAVDVAINVSDAGATLTISSERSIEPDEGLRLGGLDIAHEQLIVKFLEYTSPNMQEEWGRTV